MVQNRRLAGTPSPSLNYGATWHAALEAHYKSPECSLDELEAAVTDSAVRKWEASSNTADYRSLDRMLSVEYPKYLKTFGVPWKEEAQTVGWPNTPMVELAIELPVPGARHPYVGKLDRIMKSQGQYYIEDHKTTSRFDTNYFRQWELDNQMIGYATLAGILIGEPIVGVRINLHVIRKNDSVFERRTIPFAPERIKDWMRVYDHWLRRIESDMVGYTEGDEDAFPHNFSACAGKYGMCSYASICGLPPSLRTRFLAQDFEINPWNPLEADDDSAAAE